MIPHVIARLSAVLHGLTLLAVASCESTDRRLAEFAQRAHEQQAQQNQRLAEQSSAVVKQSQEVAAAAHDLVEHDAVARRELLEAQQHWQQQTHVERADLDRQRREVDNERKLAAQAVIRDPVIGQAIVTVGLALAALLPLVLTAYALRRLPERSASEELFDDLLLDEWTGTNPAAPRGVCFDDSGPSPRLGRAEGPSFDSDVAG